MHRQRALVLILAGLTALIVAAAGAANAASRHPARATGRSFDFYYTTLLPEPGGYGGSVANVWRGRYTVINGSLTIKQRSAIAYVPRPDWILPLPNGRLLAGAVGNRLLIVNPQTGRVEARSVPERPTGVVLDPSGRSVWGIGNRGTLFHLPLTPGATAVMHSLTGQDRNITDMAFDSNGDAYYTAEGGNFGTLDLKHFVTHRRYHHLAAARHVIFDRYTGNLVLTGNGDVALVDPRDGHIVASFSLAGSVAPPAGDGSLNWTDCSQASTDEHGKLMVRCPGRIVVIDLARHGRARIADTSQPASIQVAEVSEIAPQFFAATRESRRRRGCTHFCTHPQFTG